MSEEAVFAAVYGLLFVGWFVINRHRHRWCVDGVLDTLGEDIRSEWACPDCGGRAVGFYSARTGEAENRYIRLSWEVEPMTVACTNWHRHPLPEGAVWRMTPEESAEVEAAQRAAREAAERDAAEFKAKIVGRTITDYEEADNEDAVTLTLDNGSVLRIEAGGHDDPWLSVDLDEVVERRSPEAPRPQVGRVDR